MKVYCSRVGAKDNSSSGNKAALRIIRLLLSVKGPAEKQLEASND